MGSFMMGMDQDKKEESKLTKTTRDRYGINTSANGSPAGNLQ